MEYIKKIVLLILLFIVLILGGTFVLKLFDLLFHLEMENIWIEGFKVGFTALILLIVGNAINNRRKK